MKRSWFSKLGLWRPRFSLRALLALMLVFGSALGWYAALAKRVRDQRAAVQRIQTLGGDISYDYILNWNWQSGSSKPTPPGNRLMRAVFGDDVYAHVALVYFRQPISDADLLVFRELPEVVGIGIYDGAISGKGLEALSDLRKLRALALLHTTLTTADLAQSGCGPRLEELTLGGVQLNDAALADLPKLTGLKQLQLESASVTDDGVAVVASCRQLQSLDLFRCSAITRQGLLHLGALNDLRHLGIAGAPIPEPNLEMLENLPRLESLMLWGMPFGDDQMRHLRGLRSMRRLTLRGTQITDAGMTNLKEMRNLESLALTGSLITDAALVDLVELPKLKTLDLAPAKNMTDAGVRQLRQMSGLEHVEIGPGISIAGATELASALPTCHVAHIDANDGVQDFPPSGK